MNKIFLKLDNEQNIDNINEIKLYNLTDKTIFPWTGNNKGTDFYIISKDCAKKFIDFFDNIENNMISEPFDHFMGTFGKKISLKVYWTYFSVVFHGSLTLFKSSIR